MASAGKVVPRITERVNELTCELGNVGPLRGLRLLRGCDAQLFAGERARNYRS